MLAVVTGGAQEEGLSTAEVLLRQGAQVSIWDDDAGELARVCGELTELGFKTDSRCVDIAVFSDVARTHADVRAALGPVDALFNMSTLKNTYMLSPVPGQRRDNFRPLWELDPDRLRRAIEVNVLGMVFCTSVVCKDMVARRQGRIVSQSTSPDTQISKGHIPYGPSKSFVESFTAAMAPQLVDYGVTINVITSGGRVNRRGAPPDPGQQPSDWMANSVAYLTSDASAGVTGTVFTGGAVEPTRYLR